ncbi:MAG: gamma-glutamylcyclotransferase, partial [Planctomycetales bacterium]|nr:gamma-glutamylcyclotransferase [Planctomycetales bacterium]
MPDHLPLFAFGTLRRGECNHGLLLGCYDRWLPATLPGFRATTARHGFAVVVEDPGESVAGELFFLCDDGYDETLR